MIDNFRFKVVNLFKCLCTAIVYIPHKIVRICYNILITLLSIFCIIAVIILFTIGAVGTLLWTCNVDKFMVWFEDIKDIVVDDLVKTIVIQWTTDWWTLDIHFNNRIN